MGRVIKEWKCEAHGYFEGTEPVCPQGCTSVMQVHLTPIAIKSDKTKHNDSTLKQLALDYNMSDIKSTREGEAQPPRFANQQPSDPFAVRWGSPSQISQFNTKSIAGENVNGLSPLRSANPTGPRTASYIADHQNLKIE